VRFSLRGFGLLRTAGINLNTVGESSVCSSLAAEMCSVVYLTNLAPSPFADEISAAGYTVWEALSVSEVLHLCEHQKIDAVIIGPARAMDALLPLSLKLPTIRLESEGDVTQLVWELERLFPPEQSHRIQ
jgi:hypothetical protein